MRKFEILRLNIVYVLFLLLIFILLKRIWQLQIVDGEMYAVSSELKITRTLIERGTRGNIYDCNGQVLATKRLVYNITMTDSGDYEANRERQLALNSIIYHLQKKLQKNGEKLNNELIITIDENGNYVYTKEGNSLKRFKADVFWEANPENMTKEQSEMKADQMVEYLTGNSKFALYGEGKQLYSEDELKQYGLEQEYSKEQILNIIGIRYMLSLNSYRKYQSITIARDISQETVAYVMENSRMLTGVDIKEDWERIYEGGEAFAHILGYTGKISEEELETLNVANQEYTIESIVGKTGIEQYLDKELQGEDGSREVAVNNVGKIVGESKILKKSSTGQNVYLTIDKELQMAVYDMLEQKIAGIIVGNLINSKEFDKTRIKDTTEIKIPIYNVYMALVQNEIIKLSHLTLQETTELEKKVAEKLRVKKENALAAFKIELMEGSTPYKDLTKEMKDYGRFIVLDSGLFKKDAVEKNDAIYGMWEKTGEISLKDLLYYGIEKRWINLDMVPLNSEYITQDELYKELVHEIHNQLEKSAEIEKSMFHYLLLNDEITGKEVCELLYDQNILSKEDGDYQKLIDGKIDAYTFIKKKIENLEITPAQLALDPCSGSAVVIQAETGYVLACVTYPGYDNNRLANQLDSKYYYQLLSDKSLPLYNKATQQLTAPGSTLKPVTVAAGMEEGIISFDTSVLCNGVFDKVNPKLNCWKHTGHGKIPNAAAAIQNSCNDYLCEISYRLGMKETGVYDDNKALVSLQKYAKLFDLDKKSGIEIAESNPHVTGHYAIPSAIGQGTHNYATVQLARYANTVATKGNSFSLTMINGIEDKSGNWKKSSPALESKVELGENVWDTLEAGMIQFAQNNDFLKEMKISVAGKTGTAQEAKSRPDHALFIGYAPAKNPEISIAVRIANGYVSSNATQVGKDIFNFYFNLESKDKILTGKASQTYNNRTD